MMMFSHKPNKVDEYELIKKLGKGRFSVYLAQSNSYLCVFKVYPFKSGHISSYYANEKRFISMNHPNIIKIIKVKDHAQIIWSAEFPPFSYIVMEYAPYGDFYEFLMKRNLRMEDKLIRTYFRQLINGLEYLHQNGVSHLDLKPDNLLIGEDFQLKIADFDLSHLKGDAYIKSRGTKNLRAPELINNICQDPNAADIFSAGIILFIMKTGGKIPHREEKLYQGVDLYYLLQNEYETFWQKHCEFLGWQPEFFSPEFRELFFMMTREDPNQRATIADIKNSRWFNSEFYGTEQLKEIMQKKVIRST